MKNLFDLNGKCALVTGATRGIGLMAARGLMSAGAKVYVSSRDQAMCDQVAAELTAEFRGQCIGIAADLSTEAGVIALAEAIKQRQQGLDILINNAALHKITPLMEASFDDFTNLMNNNVASFFILSQQLLPLLKNAASKADPSRIINMGSSIVKETVPWDSYVYGASKAAMHYLSQRMAYELTADHITVNCLAPSLFPSRMVENYFTEDFGIEEAAALNMMGKVGTEEDMAGTIIYLCSRAASFVTGNIHSIDGGAALK
jgi:NAD(P)-dependent dehydrogenase (short-subunit alcohol dehydrogenase family)